MAEIVKATDAARLRSFLQKLVIESIDAGVVTDDPGDVERMYQQSTAKSVGSSGKTSRAKVGSKPADTKAPAKQAEPAEAEEDDIFAGGGEEKKKVPKGDKPTESPPSDQAVKKPEGDQPRQNRNSPEAAKFSLANAQERAHEKEKTSAQVVATPKPEDLSFDMVVTAMNILRSGQSLKDERVRQEVERYFTGLKGAERVALYSYLNGIAQIVAANVSSAQAPSPDDTPNPVSMEFAQGAPAGDGKKPEKDAGEKPNRDKTPDAKTSPSKKKEEPEDDLENTAPPITVGPREGKMHNRPRL